MFRHYEKTFRILVPQIKTIGKHFLSDAETNRLLGGNVVITEKCDGANTAIIKHKGQFRLQKRGSLVDVGEHPQFNMFKAWSQINYEKLNKIPDNIVLYGEWMWAKHTIPYDKLPDWFLAFALYNKETNSYEHRDDLVRLCDDVGLYYVPEVYRGFGPNKDQLFDLIPKTATYGSSPAEGVVVWNYKANMRGKVVREQFQKAMDEDDHWTKGPLIKNKLKDPL